MGEDLHDLFDTQLHSCLRLLRQCVREHLAHERHGPAVARPGRRDARRDAHPRQCQVPDHVHRLMPDELIRPAQRRPDHVTLVEHDRVLGGRALDESLRAEPFDPAQHPECARRREFAREGLRRDAIATVLRADLRMREVDQHFEVQRVCRMRHVDRLAVDHAHRLLESQYVRRPATGHRRRVEQRETERFRRPIHDRRFGRIHGDHQVVDLESRHRREHMLHGVQRPLTRPQLRPAFGRDR